MEIVIETNNEQNQNEQNSLVLDAIVDNKKVGYLRANLNKLKNVVEFDSAVDPNFRGQGIAGQLVDNMLNRVFNLGVFNEEDAGLYIDEVVLSIDAENFSSIRVAEKMGFTQQGEESRDSVEYVMTKTNYLKANKKDKEQTLVR